MLQHNLQLYQQHLVKLQAYLINLGLEIVIYLTLQIRLLLSQILILRHLQQLKQFQTLLYQMLVGLTVLSIETQQGNLTLGQLKYQHQRK